VIAAMVYGEGVFEIGVGLGPELMGHGELGAGSVGCAWEGWVDHVTELCVGHRGLAFSMLAAAAGPDTKGGSRGGRMHPLDSVVCGWWGRGEDPPPPELVSVVFRLADDVNEVSRVHVRGEGGGIRDAPGAEVNVCYFGVSFDDSVGF
jgi:hypothetical protein